MRWLLAIVVLALCGCPAPEEEPIDSGTPDAGHAHPARLDACAAHPVALTTVASVVDDLDALQALPAQVDNACFTASLQRPLAVVATRSDFSAQPAPDAGNPRIFFMLPKIVVSVVPAGDGEHLLEMGEWYTPTRTLKGEIALPVSAPLAENAPLTRVEQSNHSTTCALCHRNEQPDPVIDGGYISDAFRPNPGQEVNLMFLQQLHQRCVDGNEQSSRCDLFHAIFDFGPVTQGAFSPDVALFF